MPVTLTIAGHPATSWARPKVATSEDLLKYASPNDYQSCQRVIQSSANAQVLDNNHISPSKNGFVWAALHAYSSHHHLTIRPEDVWFAIITQVSFYVNKNAEELRSLFVAHEGRKKLSISVGGTADTADFGDLVQLLAELLSDNVKDPELGDWIVPSFSTTSDTDHAVASILFMGAMQKYFTYEVAFECGLPSVTLLGEVADWQEISNRLDKLEFFGKEPQQFAQMLRPILRYFLLSFEDPTHKNVVAFWNRIASRRVLGSGMNYLSGWIGAFCFWTPDGEVRLQSKRNLVLDDVPYVYLDLDEIPTGIASVPLKVNDNGNVFMCTLMAGSFGIHASPSVPFLNREKEATVDEEKTSSPEQTDHGLRMVQPYTGWLIFKNATTEEVAAREKEVAGLNIEHDQLLERPSEEEHFSGDL